MGLTKLAIQRPLTILMIILMIVVMGIRSFTLLQVELMPKADFPIVSIITVYPGASPEDIEDLVTKPIEDAVAGIGGIDTLTSNSSDGVSSVVVQFVQGVDGDKAAINVERLVATARSGLPTDAQDPKIVKADINATPIMRMVLSGPQGQDALAQVAKDVVKPRLESVQGVASVSIAGGRDRQMQVNVDSAKLAAYGLSLTSVQQSLSTQNVSIPAGNLEQGRQRNAVRAVGQFSSLADLQGLVISTGGTPAMQGQNAGGNVYLRDVATVQEGYEDKSRVLRYNGVDSVSLSVVKTGDANTIQVADDVRAVMKDLSRNLPAGAKLTLASDSSQFTRASVAGVEEDLVLAILITGLVMLVFLHTIRSTFIVVLAIPTSIIGTFLVMWALGFSLNTLTLMALTLVIGILVDDSIVVLENTERHLSMGKTAQQAALDGRSEIGLAAITITLVDVVTYLPVAFVSGIIGQFFRSYGLTIVAATLLSLAVSFTLTPMLASQWLQEKRQAAAERLGLRRITHIIFLPISWLWKKFTDAWEAGFDALAKGYAAVIRWALRNVLTQSLVVIIAGLALAAGIYLVVGGVVGSELYPQEDDGQLAINIQMPAGTNLAATDAAARQVEQIVREKVPEVAVILTDVGVSGNVLASTTSPNTASLTMQLIDKSKRTRSVTQIADDLRPRFSSIPEAKVSVALTSMMGSSGSAGITLQLYGSDMGQLTKLANQAEQIMRKVPGATDVLNTDAVRAAETQLVVNRRRASDLGMSAAQVASTLRTSLSGTEVGKFKQTGQTDIPVVLRLNTTARSNLDQLLQVPMSYQSGRRITLGQAVDNQPSDAPARVTRSNRQRVMTLTCNVTGRAVGSVTSDIEAALKSQMQFPQGYGYQFSGSTKIMQDSFAQLAQALVLSIVLIYMLMVALYQSWLHPLAIMFSLPVALVGAFGGLWLTGRTLNIISMLGIILLTGVVTKNAILIVDFANRLRSEGHNRKEALAEAGRLRLRPILMTTAALVFALLPLLFSSGAGSESRAPMAAVVIGGNITSTLLSLVLVPVAYNALDGLASAFSRARRKIMGTASAKPERPLQPDPHAEA